MNEKLFLLLVSLVFTSIVFCADTRLENSEIVVGARVLVLCFSDFKRGVVTGTIRGYLRNIAEVSFDGKEGGVYVEFKNLKLDDTAEVEAPVVVKSRCLSPILEVDEDESDVEESE